VKRVEVPWRGLARRTPGRIGGADRPGGLTRARVGGRAPPASLAAGCPVWRLPPRGLARAGCCRRPDFAGRRTWPPRTRGWRAFGTEVTADHRASGDMRQRMAGPWAWLPFGRAAGGVPGPAADRPPGIDAWSGLCQDRPHKGGSSQFPHMLPRGEAPLPVQPGSPRRRCLPGRWVGLRCALGSGVLQGWWPRQGRRRGQPGCWVLSGEACGEPAACLGYAVVTPYGRCSPWPR
jgi:hypothetical protein